MLYYVAWPPFGVYGYSAANEGNYFIVSNNLIELVVLLVLGFTQSGRFFGLDILRTKKPVIRPNEGINSVNTVAIADINRRRDTIKSLAGLPFLALFSGAAYNNLREKPADAFSGASVKIDFKKLNELKGKLPEGTLGGHNISRLIMGCNLISGFAHARDLKYANSLFKAYNTEKRVIETFHHDKYWSAHPVENRVEFSVDTKRNADHNMIHDNMFDLFPEKTAEYMKEIRKLWIAFKVLAAGAILPGDGFRYAFENGADFICVGMFDFQIVEDVNTACKILGSLKKRERGWYS